MKLATDHWQSECTAALAGVKQAAITVEMEKNNLAQQPSEGRVQTS